MTSLTDYRGRSADLFVYQLSRGQLVPGLDSQSTGGLITTGVQKLVQQVLIKLFTARGTVRHFPEDGCDFLLDVWAGVLQTEFDVFASFAASAVDIKQQLRQEETADTPADERLRGLELAQVSFVGDQVSLYIDLSTLAGDSYVLITPIPASLQ